MFQTTGSELARRLPHTHEAHSGQQAQHDGHCRRSCRLAQWGIGSAKASIVVPVLVMVRGRELPGRRFRHGASDWYDNVHVALQVRSEPVDPVPGDAADAEWRTIVDLVQRGDQRDFRGPAVHGKAGERFLYLTWGTMDGDAFTMFRRAKLMLAEAPRNIGDSEALVANVHLTDDNGLPRCARLRAPAVEWTVEWAPDVASGV